MLASNPVTANLIKAREMIADEKNWCVGQIHNDLGQRCAWGALLEVEQSGYTFTPTRDVLDRASQELYGMSIPAANNQLGHVAVMRMFDKAIELSLQPEAVQRREVV